MGTDPKSWAEAFVAELTVGGERVPFERVLAHHLDEVRKLRSTSGLTWRSIASLLTRAGARRADGSLISADQLRVGYARLVRHAEEAVDSPPPKAISRSTRGRMASGLVLQRLPSLRRQSSHPGPLRDRVRHNRTSLRPTVKRSPKTKSPWRLGASPNYPPKHDRKKNDA
jgi:hypothetical protein